MHVNAGQQKQNEKLRYFVCRKMGSGGMEELTNLMGKDGGGGGWWHDD